MDKRLLIVGTVPYKKSGPTRAYDSYFSNWSNQALAQIFSSPQQPCKGHCYTLFQVTDSMLLKRWVNPKNHVGKIFFLDDLPNEGSQVSKKSIDSSVINFLNNSGIKKSPFVHLVRGILWNRGFWCTNELNHWLEQFNPDCIVLSFSDDFFILEIALYVADKFDIPIVPIISDDYFFKREDTLSPLYFLYRKKYDKLVKDIFLKNRSAIYISDKIRDKYNEHFKLHGQTVYLSSEFERREFKSVNTHNPKINYFGNIYLDRYISLIDISKVLIEICPSYIINVYSGVISDEIKTKFDACKNIEYHNEIPYDEVKRLTKESDILLVVEGFTSHNINSTRYSLSTKVADSLQSGCSIFAYGSKDCGLIDYLSKYDACVVCTEKKDLKTSLLNLVNNVDVQKTYYEKSKDLVMNHHSIEKSTSSIKSIINLEINEKVKEIV